VKVEECDVKFFLLVSCAVVCVTLSFMWNKPWLGGLGLLCGFATMWIDRDPVRVEARERELEGTMEVRKMRAKREP
jgi:hypothetical protein